MVNKHLGTCSSDRWFLALPSFHVGGFGVLARAWEAGVECEVLAGRWEPGRFVGELAHARATLTSLVPTQVQDLVRRALPAPASIRSVVVGGGRLDEALGQAARDLGWPVLQSYGMTEAGSQIATDSLDQLRQPFRHSPLPVLPGWDVRSSDQECLEIRGPALFGGYFRLENGELQRESPVVDGWFRTSDRVELGEAGLTMIGRMDRQVKILGELVDVDALERRGRECGATEMVIVVTPDLRRGGRLVPVIDEESNAEVVQRAVEQMNRELPGFARLEPLQVVDEIPRTPLGKVDGPGLRARLRTPGE